MFMLFGICNPVPINVDCKSTEMEKAAEAKDIRLKAFSIAQGVSPGSLAAIQKQALKELNNWILVSHCQRSVSRPYARPRAHALGYKKAFSLGGLRFIGFAIQCLCCSGFVIQFQ